MKIKLFSHTDNDGNGSVILLKYFYPSADLSVTYCNVPEDTDREVLEYLKNDDGSIIYITDTSVSEEVAEKLQKRGNIRLFDHHKTALGLNKFDFCSVGVERDGELICGTKLFYQYLVTEKKVETTKTVDYFVKLVNDYDTWLWKNKYQYDTPGELNTLFNFYGKDRFIENVLDKLSKNDLSFNEFDKIILEVEEENKKEYVLDKTKDVFQKEVMGNKCVFVFADKYINDVASKLAEMYPNSEVQAMISNNHVELRTRNDSVDVSKIAVAFGGGGHKAASGFPITDEVRSQYVNMILKEE